MAPLSPADEPDAQTVRAVKALLEASEALRALARAPAAPETLRQAEARVKEARARVAALAPHSHDDEKSWGAH